MDLPSAFVLDAISRLPRARRVRALDLAMGSGRHAVPLAGRGIATFGVDRDIEKVRAARAAAAAKGLTINAWVADLSRPALPDRFFDLIVCVRFLDRTLLPLLPRALRALDVFDAIILDDLGYVQQTAEEAEVLFTLMAERYERRALIITSNLVFSQWDRIFKTPMATAAAIDRLVHHAVIIEIDRASVRAEEAKKRNEGKKGKEGG